MLIKIHPEREEHASDAPIRLRHGILGFLQIHVLVFCGEGILGTLINRGQPRELRERLKAMWTTLGVVSALLAGVVLPTVISPQQTGTTGSILFAYAIVISFGLSFTVVIICTMLIFSIDVMPTDKHIREFVSGFQHLSDTSVVLFILSIVSTAVGCLASIHQSYGKTIFLVLLVYLGSLMIFLGICFLFVHTFNSYIIVQYRLTVKPAGATWGLEQQLQQESGTPPAGDGEAMGAAVGPGSTDNPVLMQTILSVRHGIRVAP